MFKIHPMCIAMASAATLLLPAGTVYAQSTATLEEVVVTARKREESQQEVPTAVTAFNGDDMLKRGVTEFADLSQNNPNVKITNGAGGGAVASTVAIRGNLQNDTTPQIDASVGTYIDGMIISRTIGTSASMFDVESVQTAKGPQGTLFGRNTTGGAILINTVNPDVNAGVTGYVRGEAGEIGTRAYEGAVNLPVSDSVALRVAAKHSQRDDYVDYTDGTELGEQDADSYRAKLLWDISDTTELLLGAEHIYMDAIGVMVVAEQPNGDDYTNLSPVGGVFLGGALVTPAIGSSEKQTVSTKAYNLALTHELDWGEVKFLTGTREGEVGIVQSLPPGLGYTRQDKPVLDQYTAEVQINGSFFDDRLDLTSGVFYFDENTVEVQETFVFEEILASGLPFPAQISATTMETDVKSVSAYAQGTYALTERMNLTLGGRFTQDERESVGTTLNPLLATFDYDANEFNYLATLDYSFADGFMGYVSTATGYRSAGANLSRTVEDPTKWGTFEPEDVTNYEVGFKSDWLDNRLRINAAVFYQDYTGYQYTQIVIDPDTGGPIRSALSSDATIRGAELEVTMVLPADVILALGFGHVDGETDDGIVLPNIPKNTYSASLSKVVAVGAGEVDLRLNYDYRDDFYTGIGQADNSRVEERGLVNTSATWSTGDNWSIAGYINNLTDEHYYTHITYSPASPAAGGLFGLSFTGVGLPRTAGVRVNYDF